MKVGIIMGSASDKEAMKGAARALDELGIEWSAHVLSAHRVPEALEERLRLLEEEGTGCLIAGAGLSAHLPGVIASQTTLPVIGVPINAALGGMDALLSIVQMPKGVPVATVGINNSFNAGVLAAQMLAAGDSSLREKLGEYRKKMKEKFIDQHKEGVELL